MRGLALVAAVAACSGGATPDAAMPDAFQPPMPAFADRCPDMPCTSATQVRTVEELVAYLDSTATWPVVSRLTSGCVAATGEVEVAGRISLRISDLTLLPVCPTDCQE